MCASTKYDDDAMMRVALGCCCCIASIMLTSLIRCFKSASISVTSLLLNVSLTVAVTVGVAVGVGVAATTTAWDTFSPTDPDPLLFSTRRESRKLSLIGVISATVRAFPEFDAVIRPLNGRSKAFNVLRIIEEM